MTLVTETDFFHVAWVTTAASCPGPSPSPSACSLGTRTTFDEVLGPGDYFIFIDGLSSGPSYEGPYGLLVHLGPSP